jgi:hypothetical protein
MKRFIFLIAFAFASIQSSNATVTLESYKDTDKKIIKISDRIKHDDLKDFQDALAQLKSSNTQLHLNVVQLDSEGGSGNTAIEIGRLIRKNKLNTYIAPKDYCASACVPIFLGGLQRYGFGVIAVHDSTYIEDANIVYENIPSIIAFSDKKHSDYAKEMDVSQSLVDAIHSTRFWEIRYLTSEEKILWRVNGTDRTESEILVTEIAKERGITREEFTKVVGSNYKQCFHEMKYLKQTTWECLKDKEHSFDWWKTTVYLLNYFFEVLMEQLRT